MSGGSMGDIAERSGPRSLHLWGLVWLIVIVAACGGCDTTPSAAQQMHRAIEPFLEEHARFDRWARRLSWGDSAFPNREALEEAAFAPLRDRTRVAAAWLEREGPDALLLRHPSDAPPLPEDGWVRVRTERYGELNAQACPLPLGGQEVSVTLIRRSQPAPGGATLHVTLAFGGPLENTP